MAEQNDDTKKNPEDHGQGNSQGQESNETTNARHPDELAKLLADLKVLAKDDRNRGFEIGDLVETATSKYELRVADLVEKVEMSRQRLCDCRMTAVAFQGKSRQRDIPFHFFTLAARAAKKFGKTPGEALEHVMKGGFQSTREISRHFAQLGREKDNRKALEEAALLVVKNGNLLNNYHHEDFRTVITRLNDCSVKLIIADAPYDGLRKSSTSATKRAIVGNTAAESQKLIEGLLQLSRDKMAKGGALLLFRPGGVMDLPWLCKAIDANGWILSRVLTWNKHKIKLGRGNDAYGIASEKILALCQKGDRLLKHDDSSGDDVLDFKAIQPHYSDADPHHQHQKPLDMMRHFVGKHTHEGELVVEPFGGSGPACQAAVEMNRSWLYCETVKENFEMAVLRINNVIAEQKKKSA